MSDLEQQLIGEDGYLAYYTEKLWQWIPEIYRNEDRELVSPDVLRAFVETFAAEAAAQRRSIDRLWEDTIIDYADDWAVPYIGALVGTRLLSPLNSRGRRVDVAKTVAYRRRAGTPYLMEELIHDITGWHGAVTEGYSLMARAHHGFDVVPDWQAGGGKSAGLHRMTPRAGTANLRGPRGGDLINTAFGLYFHGADLRRSIPRAGGALASSRGLYDLSRLTFHLYRQKSFPLVNSTPYRLDAQRFTLDPSGRDRALFTQGSRPFSETRDVRRLEADGLGWTPAREWQLPARLSCRLFNEATYSPEQTDFNSDTHRDQFRALIGERFETAADLRHFFIRLSAGVIDWGLFRGLLNTSIDDDSPKAGLYGRTATLALGFGDNYHTAELGTAEVVAANLALWHAPPTLPSESEVLLDPATGRVLTEDGIPASNTVFSYLHHYGTFDTAGAGTHDRARFLLRDASPMPLASGNPAEGALCDIDEAGLNALLAAVPAGATGAVEVAGNATYRLAATNALTAPNLILQAADRARPYLRVEPETDNRYTINAGPSVEGQLPRLTLDGLWIGLRHTDDSSLDETLADATLPATPAVSFLRLEGQFDEVVLRHVTLDPGGECARLTPDEARAIPAVRLEINGYVRRLVIERSVVGSIHEITNTSSSSPCAAGSIEISDSIVVAAGDSLPAIDAGASTVTLKRSTVLGDVLANRLYASEALIDGIVRAHDCQNGCFRFSAAALGNTEDPGSPRYQRLPKRFESHLFSGGIPADTFISRRFGDPDFVQLASSAPQALRRGAENTSEIGVWNRSFSEVLFADLKAKLDEYKPIQAISQFIFET